MSIDQIVEGIDEVIRRAIIVQGRVSRIGDVPLMNNMSALDEAILSLKADISLMYSEVHQ